MLRKKFPNLRNVALYVPSLGSDFDPDLDGPGDMSEEDTYMDTAAGELCQMLFKHRLDTVRFLIDSPDERAANRNWLLEKIEWQLKCRLVGGRLQAHRANLPDKFGAKLEYLDGDGDVSVAEGQFPHSQWDSATVSAVSQSNLFEHIGMFGVHVVGRWAVDQNARASGQRAGCYIVRL